MGDGKASEVTRGFDQAEKWMLVLGFAALVVFAGVTWMMTGEATGAIAAVATAVVGYFGVRRAATRRRRRES